MALDVEFDVVWEGVLWMKDRGNATGRVRLAALAPGPRPLPVGEAAVEAA